MEKLIITCCINDPMFFQGIPGLHVPATVREIADSARAARDAGAAIVHIHEPINRDRQGPTRQGFKESAEYNLDAWRDIAETIRKESDVIFEHGQGGRPYLHAEHRIPPIAPELLKRTFDMDIEKPDLINVLLGSQHTQGRGIYVMPTREEMEKWMLACRKSGVKPSFEVWQAGVLYNLQWLVSKGLVDRPYWLGLFLGAQSGVGSPPTIDELLHRVKNLPEGSLWTVCPCCIPRGACNTQQQMLLVTQGITLGGHVRVGMEDNPYYWDGVPAESNAQFVERVVRIAREIGREIATPAEARRMIGLPPHA